jgi:hypothetical protein
MMRQRNKKKIKMPMCVQLGTYLDFLLWWGAGFPQVGNYVFRRCGAPCLFRKAGSWVLPCEPQMVSVNRDIARTGTRSLLYHPFTLLFVSRHGSCVWWCTYVALLRRCVCGPSVCLLTCKCSVHSIALRQETSWRAFWRLEWSDGHATECAIKRAD